MGVYNDIDRSQPEEWQAKYKRLTGMDAPDTFEEAQRILMDRTRQNDPNYKPSGLLTSGEATGPGSKDWAKGRPGFDPVKR
jgi:hypothetical protein